MAIDQKTLGIDQILERANEDYVSILEKAKEGTKGVYSRWCKPGEGSGAAAITMSGQVYTAGHMKLDAGGEIHAEFGALYMARNSAPNDPVVAAELISTNPKRNPQDFQYPCGGCAQNYADYLDGMSKAANDMAPNQDIYFICGNKNLESEVHSIKDILPKIWKTSG